MRKAKRAARIRLRLGFYKTTALVASLLLFLLIFPSFFLGDSSYPSSSSISAPHSSIRPPLLLGSDRFCTGSCEDGPCFPRLSGGLCISSTQVRVCKGPVDHSSLLPSFMRFRGEKLTLPVVVGDCHGNRSSWVPGTSLVADQRFLPYGKPNPHHEAEKLIPATLLVRKLGLSARLFWFSPPSDMSRWARGFLKAVGLDKIIVHVDVPDADEEQLCFQDAILFSAPTNVRYVPNEEYNAWLRAQVLQHCSIPIVNSSSSSALERVVILDRRGSRHLENTDEIAAVLHRFFKVPVSRKMVGSESFCKQVSEFVNEDFMLVPHGSQNVNLLFARPGAQVIEVFPYLFYNTALKNFTHAAQLRLYPLRGRRPPHNILMRQFSLLGWDLCYNKFRWCKNYVRNQAIFLLRSKTIVRLNTSILQQFPSFQSGN